MDLTITEHDGPSVNELTDAVIVPLYEATHADQLDNPFYSTERFVERLHAYATRDGFALALTELMVHPDHQRQGIARALHDRLLTARAEQRATLLVRADNTAANTAYAHWGWHVAGQLRPFPDAPTYDALLLDLPSHTAPQDSDVLHAG